MLPHSNKLSRAESARINGAKSKGPKTAEGLHRSQTASYEHGLYASRNYMLPGESTMEFAEIQAQLHAYWQPAGFLVEVLVEELAGILWETKRVHAAKNDHVHDLRVSVSQTAPHLRDAAKLNLEAEKKASVAGGSMDRFNARLAHLARERHRIEREILRLEKRPCTSGPSQMLLKINRRQNPEIPETDNADPVDGLVSESPYVVEAGNEPVPPSFAKPEPKPEPVPEPAPEQQPEPQPESAAPDITTWAATALDVVPDPSQARIMTEPSSRILVLGPRQSGKSTAAAIRVLYEAMNHDDSVILLASASGRQSGQIMEKTRKYAREIDVELLPPPNKCDGFSLVNGASIIALPDSEQTIRGFSAPRLIVVDEAAFASRELFLALEPMLAVSRGTLLLLSTPNGQTGYFYEQWHKGQANWARIFIPLESCPRLAPQQIEEFRQSMCQAQFEQEFECRFVAAGGQFISRESFRKCIRNDFPLFLPEYDLARKKKGG